MTNLRRWPLSARAALGIAALLTASVAAPVTAADSVPPLDLHVDHATRLLVLSPHPDDGALGAAGLIRRVIDSGGTVRVVLLTSGDAFAEGVEKEERIAHPRPTDYRGYGTLREHESLAAMHALGVSSQQVTFLGFPDEGLCQLASKYLSAKARAFESPYTDRVSPPLTEQVIRGVRYRGSDVRSEIERIVGEFKPTIVALSHPADEHPDHCSAHIFGHEALMALSRTEPRLQPRVLHFLIHYGQWPLSADAGIGAELHPPANFPADQGAWRSLNLTPEEAAAKKQAISAYASQMLVIGRFMLAFGRSNELFLEGEPASLPACWCEGENIATGLAPEKIRRPPAVRP